MTDTHLCKTPTSAERQSEPELKCPACGKWTSVLVHVSPPDSGRVITYLRCENCDQVKVIEEPVKQYHLIRRFLIQ